MKAETNETKNNGAGFDYEKSLKKDPKNFLDKAIRVERYINRPLASLAVRAVFNTRVTPNGLTYFSFFLGLLGAFFFCLGEYAYFVLGGVLVQLSAILDCADGMLARAKNMCSEFGSFLDLILDRVTDFVLMAAMAVGVYFYFNDPKLLVLGFLGAGLYQLQVNIFYLTKTFKQDKKRGDTGEARSLMLFSIMIFAVAGRPDLLIYILLVETVIVNIVRIIYFISLGKPRRDSMGN